MSVTLLAVLTELFLVSCGSGVVRGEGSSRGQHRARRSIQVEHILDSKGEGVSRGTGKLRCDSRARRRVPKSQVFRKHIDGQFGAEAIKIGDEPIIGTFPSNSVKM